MLDFAPKDLPEKIGPFLIVNVARSRETGVARRVFAGACRGVLCWKVARNRACVRAFVACPRTLADLEVEGLKS